MGCTTKTAAKAWEQNRRKELERAHAGLPTEQAHKRISEVAEIVGAIFGALPAITPTIERPVRKDKIEERKSVTWLHTAFRLD